MQTSYDYLVLGSGPAGHTAAITAAEKGIKTAIIEISPYKIGGTCLNEGCIPAKSLYNSAGILSKLRKNSSIFGISLHETDISMSGFIEKSDSAVAQLKKGLLFLFKRNNIAVIEGKGVLRDKNSLDVVSDNGKITTLKFKNLLIASGSEPRALPGIPFDGERIISSSEAITLTTIPSEILIVGAGAIGTELASYFNILGSKVTLMEAASSVLPNEDKDISNALRASFRKRNIEIKLSTILEDIDILPGKTRTFFSDGTVGEYEKIIISIGRVPLTCGICPENAGIGIDSDGFIQVDGKMRTSTSGIYAAGDVIRTPMLAHTASAEAKIAVLDAAGIDTSPIDYGSVPNVVYTLPETASVGITEEKAEISGVDYDVKKCFFKANGRAVAYSETEGFIKLIADKKTNNIVGAHIIGHYASELIHEFVLAKKNGITIENIAETVHAHPTFSEMAGELCR